MVIKLHNTPTGELEEFIPIVSGEARLYHCGPTVYDFAHIGNLRSYVFADTLRRVLEYSGYKVKQIINITDIGHLTSDADTGDDKMVKGLKREGLPLSLDGLSQLADKYEKVFKDDLKELNILEPEHMPRATSCLEDQIELVKILEEKGFTYRTKDGIYFDTNKVEDYGKLGNLTPIDESRARIDTGEKKSPRDFVLWKFSGDDKISFSSPWGSGFPGWHIECSAMARKFLGQPFDIHTGGADHIAVHHNNEIAQSESAYGNPLANYWLHNAFLSLGGEKIAKSAGTFLTLSDLKEGGFSPLSFRYLLLQSHYRTPTNFTWEALLASQNALNRLKKALEALPKGGKVDEGYRAVFREKIENDLNLPQALAVLWTLIKDKEVSPEDKLATIEDFDRVLGLAL